MATSGDAIRAKLESSFDGLRTSKYLVTSQATINYNCIAWAAGYDDRWTWPDPFNQHYWPDHKVPRSQTIEAFRDAFRLLGYEPCSSEDLEPGVEKVALFAKWGVPKHAARQLENGMWTSKCGESEDISHTLAGLEGDIYGDVVLLMSRSR